MNYRLAYAIGFHPWEDLAEHPPYADEKGGPLPPLLCLHFCDALSVSVLPVSYVMVSVVVQVRDFEHRMEIRNVFLTLPVSCPSSSG